MPYLSKIRLNPMRRETRRVCDSPQRLHAEVLSGLARGRDAGRTLWRLERRPHVCELLVLTPVVPSWHDIIERCGWPGADDGDAMVRDYTPLLRRIVNGRRFAFKVRANPSSATTSIEGPTLSQKAALDRAAAREGRGRGIRVGHRTAETQLQWFARRACGDEPSWGFVVDHDHDLSVRVVERERLDFAKGAQSSSGRVRLDVATYEGVLTVTDPSRLTEVLVGGMGRGKAYGCGLLTLAAAR